VKKAGKEPDVKASNMHRNVSLPLPEQRDGDQREPEPVSCSSTDSSDGDQREPEHTPLATAALALPPDPEVSPKPIRRQFPAAYKQKIVQQAAACASPREIGALLRREGLYSSHLSNWRHQLEQGLAPQKRGRPAKLENPLSRRVAELEREKQALEQRLKQAEFIIDFQKKVSELLALTQTDGGSGGKRS
jgi:transposase